MSLVAHEHGVFDRGFRVERDGRAVAEVDLSAWRAEGEATFTAEGIGYRMRREAVFGGAFLLEAGSETAARAEKPSALFSRFEVHAAGRSWELRRAGFWSQAMALFEGGREVGRLRRAGFFRRRVEIELPADLPLALQLFLLWLCNVIWTRDDTAAAG
jgi:hypothetical protein